MSEITLDTVLANGSTVREVWVHLRAESASRSRDALRKGEGAQKRKWEYGLAVGRKQGFYNALKLLGLDLNEGE